MTDFDKPARKRIRRAVHTAREAATSAPELKEVRLARFHAAIDNLANDDEGTEVLTTLKREGWYEDAHKELLNL